MLKKCKTVLKARDSFVKKYPDIALASVCSRPTSPRASKEANGKVQAQHLGANERTGLLRSLRKSQSLQSNISDTSLVSLNDSTVSGTMKRTFSEALFSNLFKVGDAGSISKKYSEMGIEYVNLHKEFVDALNTELEKVNSFYLQELQDINDRFVYLDQSVTDAARAVSSSIHSGEENWSYGKASAESNALGSSIMDWTGVRSKKKHNSSRRMKVARVLGLVDAASESENEGDDDEDVDYKKADSIKRSVVDLYRNLKLLSNYSVLNYTGFIKIIKKHDKILPEFKDRLKHVLDGCEFKQGNEIEDLNDRMEKIYADWFCFGDLREARSKMLPKQGDILQMDWTQLRLGYRLGMAAVLTVWVCWDCVWGVVRDGNSTIGGRQAFPVFRFSGCLVLLHWFWGASVFYWTRYRINYIYLFEFNPRFVRTPLMIFNDAVDETLVFLVLMLLYYKVSQIVKYLGDFFSHRVNYAKVHLMLLEHITYTGRGV